MKVCMGCGAEKALTEFYMQGSRYRSRCKTCLNAESRKYYSENSEAVAATNLAWALANPEKVREAKRTYAEGNPEKVKAAKDAYVVAHPERISETQRVFRAANPEKVKTWAREWREENPAKAAAGGARHRAAKLQATPAWANEFFIEEAYDLCSKRTKATGIQWHVDHTVPLQSDLVCGLHVEFNLAVIPAAENQSKSNRYWPEMPT